MTDKERQNGRQNSETERERIRRERERKGEGGRERQYISSIFEKDKS